MDTDPDLSSWEDTPSASRSLSYGTPRKKQSTPTKGMSPVAARIVYKYKKRRGSPIASPVKPKKRKRQPQWTNEEHKALVQHVAMPSAHWDRGDSVAWPCMNVEHSFWKEAATHVAEVTSYPIRTAASVRTQVTKHFKTQYPVLHGGIEAAEKHFGLDIDAYTGSPVRSATPVPVPMISSVKELREHPSSLPSATSNATPTPGKPTPETVVPEQLTSLPEDEQINFIRQYAQSLGHEMLTKVSNTMFTVLAESMGIVSNPSDFPELATKAMLQLQQAGKPNVIYHFAKCGAIPDKNIEDK